MIEQEETEPKTTAQSPRETKGKTFADVLDSMLSDGRRFASAMLLLVFVIGLSVGLLWVFIDIFGLSPSQVQINSFGNQITLQATSGDKQSTLIMVHPQGWEDTTIPVHKGQHVTFRAEGKVPIDSYSLVQAYKLMNDLEAHYKATLAGHFDTPEQHYKEPVRQALARCLDRLWTGPDGFTKKTYPCPDFKALGDPDRYVAPPTARDERADPTNEFADQDFPGRTKDKIMEKEPYGKLIGAVRTKENGHYVTKDTFSIGAKADIPISQDGELWLIINDVVDKNDPEASKYFYYDNVGFFIVTIETTRDSVFSRFTRQN